MTSFKTIFGDEALSGTLDRTADGTIEATVEGRSYSLHVVAAEPGIYWVKLQDRSLEVVVVRQMDGYSVSIGSMRFHVEIEDARTALRRTDRRGHDGTVEIKAPMPGKIVRVLSVEGAEVRPNQGILIMEAMKMQNEIKTPKAGTVKKIWVAEGAAVNAGDLLATVE